MQIKTKNNRKANSKKLSRSKENKLNELIEDIKKARKDHKEGKLFIGTAKQVIEHLNKL